MNKFKRMLTLALAIASLCLCAACDTEPGPEPSPDIGQSLGKTLEIVYPPGHIFTLNYNSSQSLNPITSSSEDNILFAPLLYEPLFEVTEDYSFRPVLCDNYNSPDGGKTYVIYVDTARTFHGGSNITAQDVRDSIMRAWNSSRYRQRLNIMLGVSALTNNAIMITLKYPNTQFPALLNIPIYKSGGDERAPEGTGPYMFNEDKTMLVKNPDHPDFAYLPVDEIALREFTTAEKLITAFESLELDLVTNSPNTGSYLGFGGFNDVRYIPTTIMHYLGFNYESFYMRYVHMRSAIGLAVNRSYITTHIMGGSGMAATMPLLPISPLYNHLFAATLDFSLEKSAAIFDAADIKDYDRDGYRELRIAGEPFFFELNFIVNNDSAVKTSAAREIADTLESLGIRVNLRELSWNNFQKALEDGDFDIYYGEVRLTADFDLSPLLLAKGSLNFGGLSDGVCAEHIGNYLASEESERKYYTEVMCKYIADTALLVPIAFERKQVLTHLGAARGIVPTQYNVFNKFIDWTIEF